MRSKLTMETRLIACVASLTVLTVFLCFAGLSAVGAFRDLFDTAVDVAVHKSALAEAILAGSEELISAQRGLILATLAKDAGEDI